MIRTVITPKERTVIVNISEEYLGKEVEVIAFVVEEAPANDRTLTHFASQKALAKDWLTPEEDKVWQDL